MGDEEDRFHLPPNRVSLGSFPSPTPRRLSSGFSESGGPVPSARKRLAWVSLQGRLVGAPEATSAEAISSGLSREEAAAWQLFSPLHRVLIVAISAAAAAESKRARKIAQLQRSVDLRDQLLLSMQQKLDNLFDHMSYINDNSVGNAANVFPEDKQFASSLILEPRKADDFCGCGNKIMELNPERSIAPVWGNTFNKPKDVFRSECDKDEMSKNTNAYMAMAEQEERRMSDLSICSSVTSSVDVQLSTLAAEQELYNLRKECEEKDAAIRELATAAHASSAADSKRIMELEEIIRRKNTLITKLKKDLVVVEQKVIQLTRLRRPSLAASNSESSRFPVMANNILYDMSSTSSSSSDSDTPNENRRNSAHGSVSDAPLLSDSELIDDPNKPLANSLISSHKSTDMFTEHESVSPLKEKQMNQRTASLRPRQSASSSGDFKKTRRRVLLESKKAGPQKRWV